MSAHLSGGSLGFSRGAGAVRAVHRLHGAAVVAAHHDSRACSRCRGRCGRCRRCRCRHAHERSTLASLRPGGGAAGAALLHDRAAHRDHLRVHDVHADAADAAGLHDRRGELGGVAVSVRQRHRRVSRRPAGRSRRRAARDRVDARSRRCRSWRWRRTCRRSGFTAMLAIGGLLLQSTLPISVTFAQSFVKGGAATVSSLMMGFAWGMGSLTVPLIGLGADRFGIEPTLAVRGVHPAARGRAGVAVARTRRASRRAEGRFPAADVPRRRSLIADPCYDLTRGTLSLRRRLFVRPGRHHARGQDPDHHERRACSC